MEIAFHIGAHCTDHDRLVKSLLRNRARLAEHGVSVPDPQTYRPLLRDLITTLRGETATSERQDATLEAILEGEDPARLVLSNDSFISVPGRAIGDGMLYPRAFKAGWLRRAFADHTVTFHLGIRNPASFVPALVAAQSDDRRPQPDVLHGTDPRELSWSGFVLRLQEAAPDAGIVVWCHENAPLLFPTILRSIAGLPSSAHLHGDFDMLRHIMSDEGQHRLRAYVKRHPPAQAETRQRIMAAFLDKFALPGTHQTEIDLPGWSPALVDELTALYAADIDRLAAMPGVTLLAR
ncbi:hypothetical protein SAMN04490244_101507 [Tranquillimonas rosea]|uniref:Sulfotransferase family protein n=1 Tax=Tranquillimonas rosea TaxID=641238 RepID=A0A1H9Q8L0_9RHOB|nr:hypothetical protein [Tranquillimonas rosea]SER56770.1 hypothetical protein SAMN04490244_101507 [Tranquillimonas rosea]